MQWNKADTKPTTGGLKICMLGDKVDVFHYNINAGEFYLYSRHGHVYIVQGVTQWADLELPPKEEIKDGI